MCSLAEKLRLLLKVHSRHQSKRVKLYFIDDIYAVSQHLSDIDSKTMLNSNLQDSQKTCKEVLKLVTPPECIFQMDILGGIYKNNLTFNKSASYS